MSKIILRYNKAFKWFYNDGIFVKGYFFDKENNFYQKDNLPLLFKNVKNKSGFLSKIKNLTGVFTIIIKLEDTIFIACDTSCSFPVFYTFQKNNLLISDDINFIRNKFNITDLDKGSVVEFNASAHTVGKKTLLKDVYRTQSDEYLFFNKNKLEKQGFFFSYSINKKNDSSYLELKEQATELFENAFNRFIISLENRQVLLPLSGGYDSRLIAVMLKKFNYENVVCFTFGQKENPEIENSHKTSEILGYKWIFIEYTNELINGYINTESFKKYIVFAGKYSSMPYLQEYFAVKYLKDNNLIDENSVFVPGHSGDFIGGSQLFKVISENIKSSELPKQILKKKFFLNKLQHSEKLNLLKTIENTLFSFNKNYKENFAYSVFEDFDIKEKLAKYIFNSTSVFNYFGYEHRIPFWDKYLLLFFKNIPFKYKKMKLLYDDILVNNYFKIFKVNFEKEIQPSLFQLSVQKFKNFIKPLFPFFIKKHFLIKNDWKNYEYITNQMQTSMKANKLKPYSKINNYNEVIVQWYLFYLKGLIK